jgi:hypothetical protein
MNILRRNVLKGAGAAGVVSVAMAAGLLKPGMAFASDWNKGCSRPRIWAASWARWAVRALRRRHQRESA